MNKKTLVAFNTVFALEPTPEEKRVISDLLAVWSKFDSTVAKHPAMFKRGVIFGMSMQKSITKGEITLPAAMAKDDGSDKPQGE